MASYMAEFTGGNSVYTEWWYPTGYYSGVVVFRAFTVFRAKPDWGNAGLSTWVSVYMGLDATPLPFGHFRNELVFLATVTDCMGGKTV
jgi:hypothetical protein